MTAFRSLILSVLILSAVSGCGTAASREWQKNAEKDSGGLLRFRDTSRRMAQFEGGYRPLYRHTNTRGKACQGYNRPGSNRTMEICGTNTARNIDK